MKKLTNIWILVFITIFKNRETNEDYGSNP